MKVVIMQRSGQPRVVDLPEPKSNKHFVTVRVSHSAFFLPLETYMLENAAKIIPKGKEALPLGSCASGTILDVGSSVTSLKAGLRVAVTGMPYVYHGTTLVVPESLVVELPKKVNHEEGSFAGQGAIALHLMRSARVQLGEVVLILGADMVGLLAAQIVRAAGATPILVDDSDYRLGKCRAMGLNHNHLTDDDQLVRTIDQLTDGNGVDSTLITKDGDTSTWRMAVGCLRPGGTLVLGATIHGATPLELLREKDGNLVTANGGGPGTGDKHFELMGVGYPRPVVRWTVRDNMACFCNLLADRKVQVSPLITDRIPLERATVAYEKAQRGRDAVLGVVLTV